MFPPSRRNKTRESIEVGDLVTLRSSYILYASAADDFKLGLVVEIRNSFYRDPEDLPAMVDISLPENHGVLMIDRIRVMWSSGRFTYEPASILEVIQKHKKNEKTP